ncbi:Uncharacterised protein [Mycobacteroides abscessus]|nr:Uncharacterised protein [Mycobacteroides abscessus]
MEAESPVPVTTIDSASCPRVWLKTSSVCWTVASPLGNHTLVPPSKSIPKTKPLIAIDKIATTMNAPLIPNHSVRLPTTSTAPVPVYRR